jgi:hypothetical protein
MTRFRDRLEQARGGDRGASLVLALAFLTGVGLVVGSLLSYSSTAILSASKTLEHAQTANDVAGGLQAAINTVRRSEFANETGTDCLDPDETLDYPGQDGQVVAVTCTPKPDSGVAGGLVPVSNSNKPGWALLTLGTDAGEPGIGQSGNNLFWIRGKVQSNSTITIGGNACPENPQPPVAGSNCSEIYQTATASPPVIAAGACTGRIVSTGSVSCDTGAKAVDPGDAGLPTTAAYAQPSISGAESRTAPACGSGTASTVSLEPGVYTDSAPLNALMSCTSKVILFTPGTYFFDFRNGGSGSHVWKIDNKDTTVVGGTPNGWSPTATTKPALAMPGACVSPLTTTAANSGVRFVFGGDSRLAVGAGNVELCGQWSATKPPITIYGAKADAGTGSGTGAVSATEVPEKGPGNGNGKPPANGPQVTGLGNLTVADEAAATVQFPVANQAATAGFSASGFVPGSHPPPGSILTSAVLSVRHQVSPGSRGVTGFSYTVTPGSGSRLPSVPLATTPSAGWTTTASDLRSALADSVEAGTFTGLNVSVEAAVARDSEATVAVDWLQLDLAWVSPTGIRAQSTAVDGASNCVGTAPYVSGGPNCALITTSGNQVQFYVTGTVYAPLAALDIGLTNTSGQVFRSGLIARSVRMGVSSSSTYSAPIIDVPDDTLGPVDLVVYLTAYRCPEGATCTGVSPPSAPWVMAGKAQVKYDDKGVYPPLAGKRSVSVEAWQMLR